MHKPEEELMHRPEEQDLVHELEELQLELMHK